jgi:hypothetical protein
MKKIRNIKDLERENLKLRIKQLELEEQMDHSWKELRNDLSSNNFVAQELPVTSFKFRTGNALLNGALNFGSGFLTHKLGTLAGRTVEDTAERIVGKLCQKINSVAAKKKR